MKKKMTINYIFNLAYQILIIILPLITTPYVSRILGPDGIGAYSYTASITTYFILFGCIGLNLYGQREVAYHQSDKIAISKTFFEILLLKIGTMAISICVFIFTVQMMNQYKLLFYIQLLDLIANMLDITYFYQGIEEFKVIVIRNVLIKIIGIICIFTFVKNMIAMRKSFRVFRQDHPLQMMDTLSCGMPDLSMHGVQAWRPDYSNYSRMLGMLYYGAYTAEWDGRSVYLIYNMYWESKSFDLPDLPTNGSWKVMVDTYDNTFDASLLSVPKTAAEKKRKKKAEPYISRKTVVAPRSIVIFVEV